MKSLLRDGISKFKKTLTFKFNKMTSPKGMEIRSGAIKIAVLMFFCQPPLHIPSSQLI